MQLASINGQWIDKPAVTWRVETAVIGQATEANDNATNVIKIDLEGSVTSPPTPPHPTPRGRGGCHGNGPVKDKAPPLCMQMSGKRLHYSMLNVAIVLLIYSRRLRRLCPHQFILIELT